MPVVSLIDASGQPGVQTYPHDLVIEAVGGSDLVDEGVGGRSALAVFSEEDG